MTSDDSFNCCSVSKVIQPSSALEWLVKRIGEPVSTVNRHGSNETKSKNLRGAKVAGRYQG